ncbi:RNA-directed DNA polymerase [Aeromonas hydrophila]|uniref:RNA-directed DNA polymerase n=1 Tax=Aeromonas hydrophila TaxID=644 RepID=UPI00207D3B4D|nr:reverse transcriptase domain-containing protein [Aeromonas hydrophila]MCO4220793.1 RNA-directed DNA polymerase [Aeromonas hydrophila]
MINRKTIISAYKCLKSYAYYENLNFYLKAHLAKFENTTFNKKITSIENFINTDSGDDFNKWLNKITVSLLPKKIDSQLVVEQENGAIYLSNNKISDKYIVKSVNYLIIAPAELYIIETLWSIFVGSMLDEQLTNKTFGNRVSSSVIKFAESYNNNQDLELNNQELFHRYVDNYNKWRDGGINKAIDVVSKDKNDVAILSLDLKGFYYNIDINFDAINELINEKLDGERKDLALFLNEKLQLIHEKYHEVIYELMKETHPSNTVLGIPIGFTSSAILANWHLNKLDHDIISKLNPAYYGRYVDDIFLVFSRPNIDGAEKGSEVISFINNTLHDFIKKTDESEDDFSLTEEYHSLPLQKNKLILHYFKHDHSLAGLQVFKQEIENRSSAFKFLPEEHMFGNLDSFAYDILLDGSVNKFRSIVGLAENETELSKYLSSHILAHRLCKLSSKEETLRQIILFFKGENCLRFCRLWEKVFSYTLITKNYNFSLAFYKTVESSIAKIQWHGDNKYITDHIALAMLEYLGISLSLNLALLDIDFISGTKESKDKSIQKLSTFVNSNENIGFVSLIKALRKSNLIRHHLVSWPLVNFTDYNGDLTDDNLHHKIHELTLDSSKIDNSPRYIHADEYQLFKVVKSLHEKNLHEFVSVNEFHSKHSEIKCIKNDKALKIKVGNSSKKSASTIKIALANMAVDKKSIESACRQDSSPNLSYERQKNLYRILNSATEENTDILLLPELSIPVSWLPFMAAHSRRKQISIIFGLEHWVIGKKAYNIHVETLPYEVMGKHKSSLLTFRVKNHYAPSELEILKSYRLKCGAPKAKNQRYHLIKWRGISFATYNCFELANIKHRALFRSQLDIMFACVWNKDTHYYQHITESAARDLHCYVAQSNTSHYGGSCVLQPTSSTTSNKIYVKGGENHCILTTTLDIAALREAQYRTLRVSSDTIKHNPPGFDFDALLMRSKND